MYKVIRIRLFLVNLYLILLCHILIIHGCEKCMFLFPFYCWTLEYLIKGLKGFFSDVATKSYDLHSTFFSFLFLNLRIFVFHSIFLSLHDPQNFKILGIQIQTQYASSINLAKMGVIAEFEGYKVNIASTFSRSGV